MNVDFADVRAVMAGAGTAMLGMGMADGPHRATEAALVRSCSHCDRARSGSLYARRLTQPTQAPPDWPRWRDVRPLTIVCKLALGVNGLRSVDAI